MADLFNPALFSRTVIQVRDQLRSEGPVTASRIVAGILANHPEYAGHLAKKLELDTRRGEQRPVGEWLVDVLGVYSPELLKRSGQPVLDGRLVIRALASLDPALLEQELMAPFIEKLQEEISPVLLDLPVFKIPRVISRTLEDAVDVSDSVNTSVTSSEASGDVAADDTATTGEDELRERSTELRAGYWADGEMGRDRLNLEREVETLAAVLCDDKITPPLSVGLFGDWGSGKSFFMHLLRERVALLAEAARGAESRGEESFFCPHVRQITFNSWHYSDANLWASLVTHIFDSLALDEETEPAQSEDERKRAVDERNNLLLELHSAKRLKAELEEAESRSEDLDRRLAGVLKKSVDKLIEEPAAGTDETAQSILPRIKHKLGLTKELRIDQLRTVVNDSRSLWRSLILIWRHLKPGSYLMAAAWLALVLALLFWWVPEQFDLGEYIGTALATLSGWAAILAKPIKALRSVAGDAARLLDGLERQRTEEAQRLQREKVRLEQRIRRLERDYAELTSGGRFTRLVEERAQGDSYRQQLGVISMIHRDFKQMSDLLLQSRQERHTGRQTSNTDEGTQAGSAKGPKIPRIDRIILYIDDLDRCRADRVVEVLEAVHLLLAEPLFVVVVGVDPRWLLRSLETHYTGLLTTTDGALNPDLAADWQSTPMNYLEKIFQIPYTLKPMDKTGFENLMENLIPVPAKTETPAPQQESPDDFKKDLVEFTTGKPAGDNWREAYEKIARESAAQRQADEAGKSEQEIAAMRREDDRELKASIRRMQVRRIDVSPRQLLIDGKELAFMKTLSPLIATPRAAKRLSNIYRLLRASLDGEQLRQLIEPETGAGDYPAVQILLAIVVGYPRLATFVFQKLYHVGELRDWNQFIDGLRPRDEKDQPLNPDNEQRWKGAKLSNSARPEMASEEAKLWSRLCERLNRISDTTAEEFPQELELYRRWIFKVARYSFHTGRLVVSNQEEPDTP